MKRTQMYLTEEQKRAIAQRADDLGVSQAEVVRRILDEALGITDNGDDTMRAFDAAFGIWADYPEVEQAVAQGRRLIRSRVARWEDEAD